MSCFCDKSFCYKQLLDAVFLTPGIDKVAVSQTEGCEARLTTLAKTFIIPDYFRNLQISHLQLWIC